MAEDVGEIRNAIIEEDNRLIKKILHANEHRTKPYWIVVFAKPMKQYFEGKPILRRHIKAYPVKPRPQVGMITGEVNNATGKIVWDVNMPQVPFDFNSLVLVGARPCNEVVIETTSIPGAYITS